MLLDGETAFAAIEGDNLEIYGGANIRTPQDALASGPLAAAKEEIEAAQVRDAAGFVMDAYPLRRKDPA